MNPYLMIELGGEEYAAENRMLATLRCSEQI